MRIALQRDKSTAAAALLIRFSLVPGGFLALLTS
jgi:hypothetical protein